MCQIARKDIVDREFLLWCYFEVGSVGHTAGIVQLCPQGNLGILPRRIVGCDIGPGSCLFVYHGLLAGALGM